MTTNTTTAPITIGTRVHSILYGGRNGTVIASHGCENEKITFFPGVTRSQAEHDIVWDGGARSFRTPEAVMRGVQWRILEETTPLEEIEALITMAEHHAEKIKMEEALRLQQQQVARERFLEEHPQLIAGDTTKIAAQNIRTQLKQAFKQTRFSVRSDHNSITIGWTDGPTIDQVDAIAGRYKLGHFDGMDDSYRYDDNRAWPFGGVSYLQTHRSIDEQTRADAQRIIAAAFDANCDLEQERYRAFRKTAIQPGHRLTGLDPETLAFTTATNAR